MGRRRKNEGEATGQKHSPTEINCLVRWARLPRTIAVAMQRRASAAMDRAAAMAIGAPRGQSKRRQKQHQELQDAARRVMVDDIALLVVAILVLIFVVLVSIAGK